MNAIDIHVLLDHVLGGSFDGSPHSPKYNKEHPVVGMDYTPFKVYQLICQPPYAKLA